MSDEGYWVWSEEYTCRRRVTHKNFHVARPSAALNSSRQKYDWNKGRQYLVVSFPNLVMITPPSTPTIGFGILLFIGKYDFRVFSTPPSPKSWPVHGSMYARDGGCNIANTANINWNNAKWQVNSMNVIVNWQAYNGKNDDKQWFSKTGNHSGIIVA